VLIVPLPGALLLAGLRAGIWTDLDLTPLKERRTFLPWATLCAVAAAAVAWRWGFAPVVLRASLGIAFWLAASAVISLFWKVSLHTGATMGIVILVWAAFGAGAGLALVWTPLAVAWSRVVLRKHDMAQVVGGIVLGAIAAALVLTVVP
jgi:hypothetical protein